MALLTEFIWHWTTKRWERIVVCSNCCGSCFVWSQNIPSRLKNSILNCVRDRELNCLYATALHICLGKEKALSIVYNIFTYIFQESDPALMNACGHVDSGWKIRSNLMVAFAPFCKFMYKVLLIFCFVCLVYMPLLFSFSFLSNLKGPCIHCFHLDVNSSP